MKFVAILLMSILTIAMVVAFPDNDDADAVVPAGGQHALALASPADEGSADSSPSADQSSNSIRRPRHLLGKLLHPQPVVVQPIIVSPGVYPRQFPGAYSGYGAPYPYYNEGRSGKYW
ncbi:uncharacterized protein [Drosophila kikkawai]|uniref:Uncharacterized protein n=1 Tax=Drosophila kikkawai TaxID=30033 RepID=A0A6P4IR63_DROKI|nr:uncharacterized protein LOC108076812 [Drosophila kikkawai]